MPGSLEWARPARWSDLRTLRSLWDRADAEIGVGRGGERLVGAIPRPPELDAPPRQGSDEVLPAGGDRLLVVGGIDEVVLGFVAAGIDRSQPAPVALLHVAFVEQEARGVGIGEAMVELVLAWAERSGCAGVDAYALPGSRVAKAFFEDHGFVARLLTMYRRLPVPSPAPAPPPVGGPPPAGGPPPSGGPGGD
ncbi:GNAT family N-acetyltransferase [Acidimicrobiaceae bacterium USS-CC1]|uniref:GNAT family N-acetyltransferase n=1 Tax=Acidiferrimicrobium australe TaxID=2664430 RepID=A0ABW9QSY1_9ACTN|nr:GNAT family N-acetyltransferase [Acidiferrimicrobium australe]